MFYALKRRALYSISSDNTFRLIDALLNETNDISEFMLCILLTVWRLTATIWVVPHS